MKKITWLFLLCSTILVYGAFSPDDLLNDGPYVFQKGKRKLVQWIENSSLEKKYLTKKNYGKFKNKYEQFFDPQFLFSEFENSDITQFDFQGVEKIAALSDVHGQYDLFIKILKNNGIIDQENNWSFGNGHFVIVGDVFDRGDKVQECLWFIYQLEQQAAEAGGRVHYLLGNHEVMVLTGDLRYIHDKYRLVEQQLQMPYWQIFGPESVLGAWLRTKPITMGINDIQFVHGGLSPALVASQFTVESINSLFRNQIIDAIPSDSIYNDPRIKFIDGSQGPIWYRGYFKDSNFTEVQLDAVLRYFEKKKIVVGHTSQKKVKSLFNDKVIVVDSSIKLGEKGEVLLIEKGEYFIGNVEGKRRAL